jgi:hypothetical protein
MFNDMWRYSANLHSLYETPVYPEQDLGAFGVLPLPEKKTNVFRILGSAWRHWNEAPHHAADPVHAAPACAG